MQASRTQNRATAVIGWTVAIYVALLSVALNGLMFATQTYEWFAPDFSVFWTVSDMLAAGRLGEVYDPVAVTAAHSFELHPGYGLRPWVYPPSALLAVEPLAFIPLWVAFGLWIALSALIFALVVLRCWPDQQPWMLGLAMIGWPVMSAMNTGQSTLLIGAAVIGAVVCLKRRPALAGTLFAVAALLKPSFVVLAPFAMAAGGHWRALATSIGVGLSGLALTTIVYGVDVWWAWLAALDGFFDLVVSLGIHDRAVTPRAFAALHGASTDTQAIVQVAGAILGLAIACLVFARSPEPAFRLVALIGGGFLAGPYAMHYDLAVLVPVAALLLIRPKADLWDLGLIIPAVLLFFPIPPVTAVCAVTATIWVTIAALIRPSAVLAPVRTP